MHKCIRTAYGYCSWEILTSYAIIHTLWVNQTHRRQGHARELIQTAIEQIKAAGFHDTVSIVAIPQDNSIPLEKLKAFYESLGLAVFDYYG